MTMAMWMLRGSLACDVQSKLLYVEATQIEALHTSHALDVVLQALDKGFHPPIFLSSLLQSFDMGHMHNRNFFRRELDTKITRAPGSEVKRQVAVL